ncbi:MAG TPA: WXG100 family type VII secretion target [Mycobacteriales bacterium]|nr:WXG100 family type VII secretion target [Mycobacteriales bacterium]
MTAWCASLGLDPAPGDPAGLRAIGRTAARTAEQMTSSGARLRALAEEDGLWRGEAAQAYRARLGTLPGQLDDAARALHAAERALEAFAGRLEEAAGQARRLALLADEQRALLPAPAAQAHLHAMREQAQRLHSQVLADSRTAQRALHAAADAAPRDPGWLRQVVDGVDAWLGEVVREHAVLVEVAAFVLSVAAGATMATGLVPLTAALAGMSLAASWALHHYGEATDAEFAVAVAGTLTLGVGGAALRVAGAAPAAAPAAAAAVAARVAAVADRTGKGIDAWSAWSTGRSVGEAARRELAERSRSRQVLAPGAPPSPTADQVLPAR